jgi:hypothetical protein
MVYKRFRLEFSLKKLENTIVLIEYYGFLKKLKVVGINTKTGDVCIRSLHSVDTSLYTYSGHLRVCLVRE